MISGSFGAVAIGLAIIVLIGKMRLAEGRATARVPLVATPPSRAETTAEVHAEVVGEVVPFSAPAPHVKSCASGEVSAAEEGAGEENGGHKIAGCSHAWDVHTAVKVLRVEDIDRDGDIGRSPQLPGPDGRSAK